MSNVKDYYKILGVSHAASTFEIEQAYEKLANKWLPERHKANIQEAESKFKDINEAFEVLFSKNSRSHYDEILQKGYSFDDAQSTFNKFFQEHDFVNEQEKQFFQSLNPQPSNTKQIKNYYEVLGLPKSASLDDIKKKYRTLAIKYHPKNSQNDEKSKAKFLQINQAYEVLSDQKKKNVHQKLFNSQFDDLRTHSIFEQFFGLKPFEFPSDEQFFQPITRKRWSRMLDRLMEQDEFDFSEIKSGQTFKQSSVYTKDKGVQTRKNVKSRVVVQNGTPIETKIQQYIFPNGQKDVVRTTIKNGTVEKTTYHLKKDQHLPKQLTL